MPASAPVPATAASDDMSELRAQVAALTAAVDRLSRSRSSSRSASRSGSPRQVRHSRPQLQTGVHMADGFPVGKQGSQAVKAAITPGSSIALGRLLFIRDPATTLSYLIDTGAAVSVIPPRVSDKPSPPSVVQLQAANGTPIRTFGERSLSLTLGLRRNFTWTFVVADVTSPILRQTS